MPNPLKMTLPPLAASSLTISAFVVVCVLSATVSDSFEAAALRTSAQAVPSGYFSLPCSATISARRSGIIIRMPSNPPRMATSITRAISRSNPRIIIAGIVTPRPNAIDSPADPAVWTILFCKTFASRKPNFERIRKKVMESTATGMDALTVKPTLRTRYNDDAPKTIPRNVPVSKCGNVSSGNCTDAGMNGLKLAASGFVGRAPTISGYSPGGFALSTVAIRKELSKTPAKCKQLLPIIVARLTEIGRTNNFEARACGTGTAARSSRSTTKDQADRDGDKNLAAAKEQSRSAVGGKRGERGSAQAKNATGRDRSQEARARRRDAC